MMSNDTWPPEIDVFEFKGTHPERIYMGHFELNKGGSRAHHDFSRLDTEFHVYSVEWNSSYIKWFFDNTLIFKTKKNIPHKPLFVLSTFAIAGSGFAGYPNSETIFPDTLEIDYIRCYEKE